MFSYLWTNQKMQVQKEKFVTLLLNFLGTGIYRSAEKSAYKTVSFKYKLPRWSNKVLEQAKTHKYWILLSNSPMSHPVQQMV